MNNVERSVFEMYLSNFSRKNRDSYKGRYTDLIDDYLLNTRQQIMERSALTLQEKMRLIGSLESYCAQKKYEYKRMLLNKKRDLEAKFNSIDHLYEKRMDMEILSPAQRDALKKYQQDVKKARFWRNFWLVLTIILTIITIGLALIFIGPWIKDKKQKEYDDTLQYDKYKLDLDGANKKEVTLDILKDKFGSNNEITIDRNDNFEQRITVVNGDKTIHYVYDKVNDVLSSSDGNEVVKDYLSNHFSSKGGIILKDNDFEKVVKIGDKTYTWNKKEDNILLEYTDFRDDRYNYNVREKSFFLTNTADYIGVAGFSLPALTLCATIGSAAHEAKIANDQWMLKMEQLQNDFNNQKYDLAQTYLTRNNGKKYYKTLADAKNKIVNAYNEVCAQFSANGNDGVTDLNVYQFADGNGMVEPPL